MKFNIKNRVKVIVLNFLSLFNRKKRTAAVLADTHVITPIQPKVEVQRAAYVPAVGKLRDITMMLDRESVELYGRSPFIKD